MKTVVVQAYCDLHPEPGQVPATEEVTYNGRLLDVCAEHKVVVDEAIEALNELFASGVLVDKAPPVIRRGRGRPPGGHSNRIATLMKDTVEWRTCPECGHVAPTRSATGQHLKQKHDKVLGDYTWPESEST